MVSRQPTTRPVSGPGDERGGPLARGTVLDGRYAVLDPLGQGGMATVYRARDERLGRLVALKILDARDAGGVGGLLREDRALARLAHPHIVSVYDSGATPDGLPYLVLELIDGAPASRLAPLSVARALRIAEQVAAALAYAHERGVVHCDVTPQNILLDARGAAKLTDFGVASADAAPVGATVYGAAAYLAPERRRGAPTSPAVDIYALGATLHFLLTGHPPHGEDGAVAVPGPREGAATAPLAPPLPAAVAALVRRALDPDPAARFPSAAALGAALATLGAETTGRVGAGGGSGASVTRGRAALVAALVALLIVGVLGVAVAARRAPAVAGGDPAAPATVAPPAPSAAPITPAVVQPPPTIFVAPTASAVAPPPAATAAPAPAVVPPPTATPTAPAIAPPAPAAPAPAPAKGGKDPEKDKDKDKDKGKP